MLSGPMLGHKPLLRSIRLFGWAGTDKDTLSVRTFLAKRYFNSCEQMGQKFLPGKVQGGLVEGSLQMLDLSSVQLLSRVRLFATPWTAAHQASLFFTISWSFLILMSTESMMSSNYLILCHPLLLPSSIFPSIRVFSNELALQLRWPKYWTFSISPSNE